MERNRRSKKNKVQFNQIVASAEIKQWGSFLSSNQNKNLLIRFLVSEWKSENYRSKIGGKEFFVACEEKTFKISENDVEEIQELGSNHEEADTRMALHVQDANNNFEHVLVASPDTDVFIILLSISSVLNSNMYFLTGVKDSRRIIDVTQVGNNMMDTLNPKGVDREQLMKSLIGFHSFTGCDTISAFAGKGKVKPLKLMVNNLKYLEAFSKLGEQQTIDDDLMNSLLAFVCHMYGWKETILVNEVRYRMYCQSGGKVACEKLPPCESVVRLHAMRANYQAYIWRQSLLQYQDEMDPTEHGWLIDIDGNLDIKWMDCNPAPDEVRVKQM